jgi:Ca2+-binding EF-hand superfamily protein
MGQSNSHQEGEETKVTNEYVVRKRNSINGTSDRIQQSADEAMLLARGHYQQQTSGYVSAVAISTVRAQCSHEPQHKQYFLPPKRPELNEIDYAFLCDHAGKSKYEIDTIFERYGLNKLDARISKMDFKNIYQDLHYEPDSEHVNEIVDQVYAAFDSDCTGYLSFNEFMVAYVLTCRADTKKKLEYSFDLYDYNHATYLEADELKSVIGGMFDVLGVQKHNTNPHGLIEETIAKIKSSESGRISKADFIYGLMSNPAITSIIN